MLCLPLDLLTVGQYMLSFTPMAKLFMLKERIEHEGDCPLLWAKPSIMLSTFYSF